MRYIELYIYILGKRLKATFLTIAQQYMYSNKYSRLGNMQAMHTKASQSTTILQEGNLSVQGVQLFKTIPTYNKLHMSTIIQKAAFPR